MKNIKYILLGVVLMWLALCLIAFADTLGQRNNNPLNLKAFHQWQGLIGKDKFGHCIFKSLEFGIRAGLINLKTHIRKHPSETLEHYLSTFAEKNSDKETDFVADRLYISETEKLKNINLIDFFIALAEFESGMKIKKKEVIRIKEKYNI